MDYLSELMKAIAKIGDISAWQFIAAITAAGTIAMAMLQLVKDLTPLRRWYQKMWLRRWIGAHAQAFNQSRKGADKKSLPIVSDAKAEVLLVDLATGGDRYAFYDLAAEQMVAQMNAAAQISLDYPKTYSDLLVVLAEGIDVDDVATVISQSPEGSKSRKASPSPEYLEARTRVGHRIQRNLDAVQISLSSHWRFWMQSTAIVLSILLLELGVFLASTGRPAMGTVLVAIPVGILGGYLAPVTRDLVSALQTLRK